MGAGPEVRDAVRDAVRAAPAVRDAAKDVDAAASLRKSSGSAPKSG